jgi:hypothetical protein
VNHYEKKDKKEIKSNYLCLNCSRQLTATELFYYSDKCVICKIKNGPNLNPVNINEQNINQNEIN